MKRKHIITGLLVTSISLLAFVGCSKKKTKTNKTTNTNTSTVTQTNKTTTSTKTNTTSKTEDVLVNKCYASSNILFVNTYITNEQLTDFVVCIGGNYGLICKPTINDEKFDSITIYSQSSSKMGNLPVKTIKKADKFTPVVTIMKELMDYNYNEAASVRVSDNKIDFKLEDMTFQINIDGSIDGSLTELSSTPKNIKGALVTYSNGIMNVTFDDDYNYVITLKKDLYEFLVSDQYRTGIKLSDDGDVSIYSDQYDLEKKEFLKINETNVTVNKNNEIEKITSTYGSNISTTLVEYDSNNNKIILEQQMSSGGSIHPLGAVLAHGSTRTTITLDKYGRTIEYLEEMQTGSNTYTAINNYTYEYDDFGNIVTEINHKSNPKYKYIFTYNDKNLLETSTFYQLSDELFVEKTLNTFTYNDDNIVINRITTSGGIKTFEGNDQYDEFGNTIMLERLYYSSENKLSNSSSKKEYIYDDKGKTLLEGIEYKAKSDGTSLYKYAHYDYEYTESTLDDKKYTLNTTYAKYYNEDNIESSKERIEYVTYVDENRLGEVYYSTTKYDYNKAANDYLNTFDYKEDYYENVIYEANYTYDGYGNNFSRNEKSYIVTDKGSQLYLEYIYSDNYEITNYFYDIYAEEIVPCEGILRSEATYYDKLGETIESIVTEYGFIEGMSVRTYEFRYERIIEDDVTTYKTTQINFNNEYFPEQKTTEEINIYDENEKWISTERYEYSYNPNTEEYTRLKYLSDVNTNQYLDCEEIYHIGEFYTKVLYEYNPGHGEYHYLTKKIEYTYNNLMNVTNEFNTYYNQDGTEKSHYEEIGYIYDLDNNLTSRTKYESYTSKTDLKHVQTALFVEGIELYTYMAALNSNDQYTTVQIGDINKRELSYTYVIVIIINSDGCVLNANLYVNNFELDKSDKYTINENYVGLDYDTNSNIYASTTNYTQGPTDADIRVI
ncbi:MAG: hypothetical protein J6Y28_09315 [Acholeplasmatales bacterium]|nr:hypothetical protein [Acholeplasmatales bacterium]